MKAVIVGGGFAGLAAANRLRKASWDVTVLEAQASVGGRASTFQSGNYRLERGACQMSTGWKELMALVREFGLESELAPSSNVIMLVRNGRRYEMDAKQPVRAALSGVLSLRSKFRMIRAVRDFLAITPRPDVLDLAASHALDVESAQQYAQRRLNLEIYETLIAPMIRAYILNSARGISVVEWFSVIANCQGQQMYALRGGSDRLPKAIAATLDVRTQAIAERVRGVNGGVEVDYVAADGTHTKIAADACVVATQLPVTARLVPEMAHTLAPLATRLQYNRNFCVQLGYDRLPGTPALGVLFPESFSPLITHFWMEHAKNSGCSPPGHALIAVHMDDSRRDSIEPNTEAEFIRVAREQVESFFPELRGHNDLCVTTTWERAIPQPTTGTYAAVHALKQRLDPAGPIQIAGDYFTCTGQNSAIHWGNIAAQNLIAVRKG